MSGRQQSLDRGLAGSVLLAVLQTNHVSVSQTVEGWTEQLEGVEVLPVHNVIRRQPENKASALARRILAKRGEIAVKTMRSTATPSLFNGNTHCTRL